jgi:hypothetical protein
VKALDKPFCILTAECGRNGRRCEIQFNVAPAQAASEATKRAKDALGNHQANVFQIVESGYYTLFPDDLLSSTRRR